jgi:O-antigen/teichoic acid export membrane protein
MVIISFVFFFVSISNVGYYYYNGLGKAKINMISSFVGAFSYLASAFVLIPKFNLKGAAYSFIFVLLPFPVYIYILNRMLNFSQVDYLKILSKSLGLILLTLALNYVSYFISIIYILINGLIFILLICFIFVLKIVDLGEIKKIIDRV